MQQEEKQQSVKQKTLETFFKRQNPAAAPPPTVLQRVLQDKQASSKLQEARAKGQQLVVLTPEELQQAIEDRAALRGTPGRPRFSQPEQSLVAGLRVKKNNLQKYNLCRQRRVEESAGTKAVIADELVKMSESAASPAEFKRTAMQMFDKPWKSLQKILKNREEWHTRAAALQIGKLAGRRKQGVANQHLKRGNLKTSRGCRKLGAGRPDMFAETKQRVKAWLERERMMQHAVDVSDLLEAFVDDVKEEVVLLERKLRGEEAAVKKELPVQKESNLPGFELLQSLQDSVQARDDASAKQRLAECKERLCRLQEHEGYRKSFKNRLVQDVGGKLHRPGRLTQLTLQEEEQAIMETWLEFDAALEVAAFGDEEQLAKFVQNPVQFQQHRADCIIGWSDQIPCWLKMTRGKQVYAASERSKKARLKTADFQKMQDEKLKSLDEAAELLQKAKDIEDAEEETEAIQAGGMEEEKEVQKETGTEEQELQKAVATTLQEETALGDTTLRRGVGSAEDEKWRCTVEHRLVLKNYFKQGEDPEAYNWRPALIVKTASHCRLSNITAEGTWREDEQFEAAGKVVMRSAGRSAGRVLAPWLKLREQGLLQNWEVYGQPAAVTDAVIQQWMLQSMGEQFPCSIWVRDAVGSSWAPEVQLSMRVIGQIAVKIRAGITDLVQPTDTDFAASLKASLRAAQSEEKKRMMESAAAAGERASFKCSVPSLGRMLDAAWQLQEERQAQRPWTLQSLRRNGFLHWRPDFVQQKLVLAAKQKWAAELPEGSYRLQSKWLENRSLFLDSKEQRDAAMQKLKNAKLRADQSEIAYCHHEGYCRARVTGEQMLETHLEIEADELEDEVLLQALPFFESLDTKVQRRLKRAALGPPAGDEQQEKATALKRKKRKRAAAVLKQGKKDLQELLQKHNRKEILQGMVPSAGGSKLGSFAAKMKLSLCGLLKPGPVQTKAAAKKAAAKKPAAEKAAPKQPAALETAEQETAADAEHKSSKKQGGKGKLQKKASKKSLEKEKKKKALKKALKQLQEDTEVAGAAPASAPAAAPAAGSAAAPAAEEKQRVQVCSELAGKPYYGRMGVVALQAWKSGAETLHVDFQPGVQSFRREFLQVPSLLPGLTMKTMQSLSRAQKQKLLREAALKTLGDDLGDDVRIPLADGSWLLDQHMSVGWQYLQWSLPGLEKADITCIRADVVQAFTALADPTTELQGLGDEEWLLCASQMQEQRKAFLQEELKKDLIFVPIYAGSHWTLLEICRYGGLQVRYYDSLQEEHAANRRVAEFFLDHFLQMKLPARCNAARQPVGTGQCGSYCLQWMETACRQALGDCQNLQWPSAKAWAGRLQTLCKALQKEQSTIMDTKVKAAEKKALLEAKQKKAAASKKKGEEDMKSLSKKALEDLLKNPAGKPCFEGFTGGTCTRCREGDGCLSCSRWKATRYWLQKEGFSVDHLYGASGAALYQKSKLQREAQLAAYPTKVAEAPESQCTLQL